jgi:hypothetical protein
MAWFNNDGETEGKDEERRSYKFLMKRTPKRYMSRLPE